MSGISWAATLAEARARAAEDKRLMLTYVFSPG